MDSVYAWLRPLLDELSALWQQLLAYLPRLIGGLLILLAGWLLARLLSLLTLRFVNGLDRVFRRFSGAGANDVERVRRSSAIVAARLVFWAVVLVAVASAASLMRLELFSGWLDRLVAYLPALVSGALIILAGVVFGAVIRGLVSTATISAGIQQSLLLGRLAQGMVLITAVVIGVDQIGVDVSFLVIVAAVSVGALLGGAALAFGLGTQHLVSNMVNAHYLRKYFDLGERIRIGDIEGRIVELGPTAVTVESPEGQVRIPARAFDAQNCTRLAAED